MPLSEKHDETKTYDDILNAGPPLSQLAQEFITPTALFFVRTHSQIPHFQLDSYRLRAHGLVTRELSLSLDDIKSRIPAPRIDRHPAMRRQPPQGNWSVTSPSTTSLPGTSKLLARRIGRARDWAIC